VESVDQVRVSEDGLISARFTFTPEDSSLGWVIAQWDADGNNQSVGVAWRDGWVLFNGQEIGEFLPDGTDPSVFADAPLAGLTLDAAGDPMFLWNFLNESLTSEGLVVRAPAGADGLATVLRVDHDFGDSMDGAATAQTIPQLSYLSFEGSAPEQHGGTVLYGTYQGSLDAVVKVRGEDPAAATVIAYEATTATGALSDNPHLRGVVGSAGGHIGLLADSDSGAGALYVISTKDMTSVVVEVGATVGGLDGPVERIHLLGGNVTLPPGEHPVVRDHHVIPGSGQDGQARVFSKGGRLLYELLDGEGGHAVCLTNAEDT
jgi:hypothetical protein